MKEIIAAMFCCHFKMNFEKQICIHKWKPRQDTEFVKLASCNFVNCNLQVAILLIKYPENQGKPKIICQSTFCMPQRSICQIFIFTKFRVLVRWAVQAHNPAYGIEISMSLNSDEYSSTNTS